MHRPEVLYCRDKSYIRTEVSVISEAFISRWILRGKSSRHRNIVCIVSSISSASNNEIR